MPVIEESGFFPAVELEKLRNALLLKNPFKRHSIQNLIKIMEWAKTHEKSPIFRKWVGGKKLQQLKTEFDFEENIDEDERVY